MFSLSLREVLKRYHSVEVGDYSYGSLLEPGSSDRYLKIGRYVSVGKNVTRIGASHPLGELCLHPFWYNPRLGMVGEDSDVVRSPCHIEDGAWIGANVVILPGCNRIGVGAVVGAGSVVTRDVEDFAVVAGNPAKTIRYRLDEGTRDQLLREHPWSLPPALAQAKLKAMRPGW